MKKFLHLLLITAFLLSQAGGLFAQTKMKISGLVADSSKPLSFVTVRIFKLNNKTPLQTTLSTENGRFELNKPDTGNYLLTFTHTGFTEKQISINVGPAAGDMQIEPVQLAKANGMLKEVVITS